MSILGRTVFIFDIDGTIADNSHRKRKCMQCGTYNPHDATSCSSCEDACLYEPLECWEALLSPELVAEDKPIADAQRLIHHMRSLHMQFHFVTGRIETLRSATQDWLARHFGWNGPRPYCDHLYMRSVEQRHMPAAQCKEQLLHKLIEDFKLQPTLDRFVFFEADEHVFGTYSKYGVVLACPDSLRYFCPPAATTAASRGKRAACRTTENVDL